VVAAHSGKVTVWSKEGVGSTFTLRLPAIRNTPAADGTRAAGLAQPAREAVK
jgi:two-component system sensor histidine kinase SenX3